MNQIAFFLIHCILHLFGYWIPRAVRFVCAVICCCRPCVEYQRERYGYIYHPEREVRLLHNPSVTGCAVDVFGLMDVKASEREDRQFCVDPTVFTTDKAARAEKKRLLKEAEDKNMLSYDSPLYSGHVGTVMGALRPPKHVPYCREEMTGWDGGPVFIDWLYVDGEGPLPSYKHSKCPGFEDVLANNDNNASEGQQHGIASDDGGVAVSMASPSHEPAFSSSEEGDGEHHAAATSPSTSSANAAEPFKSESKVKGVCFVLPGMSSESQSNYVQSFVRCMHANGYHCAVLNTRGMASNTPLTTTFLFNGGYTRDCRDCLRSYLTKDALAERFGRPLPVIGCGLSIGGAVLSKYLGEQGRAGRDPVLDAGVTVCAPNDFVSMVEHMNRGTYQKGIYQEEMCNDVRNYILRHNELKTMANVDNDWAIAQGNVHRFTRIIHFDEHIVAKSAGYRSIHHYHLDTSAIVWLPYTPIPTFALATFDDPVIGRTVMPHRWREIIASNPRVVYAEVRSGGHLGFLGTPWEELTRAPNWMEKFVLQRLDSVSAYWFDKQKSHNGGACDPWIRILSTPQGAMSEEKRLSQDSDAAQSVFSWVPNLPDIGNSNNTINNNNNNNNNNNEDAHNSNTSATNTHTNINTELRDGLASIRTIPAQRVKCNDSDQKIQANQANANTNKKKESKLDYFARYQPPPADRTNNICYFTDDTLREEPHLSLPAPLTPYFLSQRVAACDGQLGGGGGPHRRTEYRYDPVRVNCDYSIDPRRYMEAII